MLRAQRCYSKTIIGCQFSILHFGTLTCYLLNIGSIVSMLHLKKKRRHWIANLISMTHRQTQIHRVLVVEMLEMSRALEMIPSSCILRMRGLRPRASISDSSVSPSHSQPNPCSLKLQHKDLALKPKESWLSILGNNRGSKTQFVTLTMGQSGGVLHCSAGSLERLLHRWQ